MEMIKRVLGREWEGVKDRMTKYTSMYMPAVGDFSLKEGLVEMRGGAG